MIQFDRFQLDNGLKVLVHQDFTTPIVAINVLYDVGARDENPSKTGFAHLFEHLMFGGSINIPRYDGPLERAGGENNAFTSNDITSYYVTLPRPNIETALWLESDRMLDLAFSKKSLRVQRNVVMEEFRQTHLNQPYGDAWLLLRPLAYRTHPYRWATIGADIQHIASATMPDVKDFYKRFYHPGNAILTVAGPVETEEIHILCRKWFGNIPVGPPNVRQLPHEAPQTEARHLEVAREVPHHAIYKAWHMPGRFDANYKVADIVSDLLSAGDSSRLFVELVKKQQLFSDIEAYISGSIDPGLIVVTGKLINGVTLQEAETAIESELSKLRKQPISERELQKVKNRFESMTLFSEMKVLEKTLNLSYYELLGDATMINTEVQKYQQINAGQVRAFAQQTFVPTNCSTLHYKARNNHES
ncbi:MAG: pitrilysin family protein [Bacteroidales bacterium]|nr:pitrilysin family protein [Bacteroidales bacterium]MDZ4203606.1 pitrilysin family protein [Bacteroidales bacterium]